MICYRGAGGSGEARVANRALYRTAEVLRGDAGREDMKRLPRECRLEAAVSQVRKELRAAMQLFKPDHTGRRRLTSVATVYRHLERALRATGETK